MKNTNYVLNGVYKFDKLNGTFSKVKYVPDFINSVLSAKKLFWYDFWQKKYTWYQDITKNKCMTILETYFSLSVFS